MIQLIHGDCLEKLKDLPENSVDSIVTDPPYGLSFMGKKWDYDVPSEDIWRECLRVLKPGGHLLAFAGTRTQHRMAVRIEDAGFEIRDMIAWVYGSGFPKSLNIGKAVDKLQGNGREAIPDPEAGRHNKTTSKFSAFYGEIDDKTDFVTKGTSPYEGWGTALKPALEPITVARKPLDSSIPCKNCNGRGDINVGAQECWVCNGTGKIKSKQLSVAENVLTHGTGGINIDGCRVGESGARTNSNGKRSMYGGNSLLESKTHNAESVEHNYGRFPANLIHDGSEEVVGLFPESKGMSGGGKHKATYDKDGVIAGGGHDGNASHIRGDNGSAARFFYCAKANKKDRDEGLSGKEIPIVTFATANGTSGKASSISEGRETAYKNNHPTVKPTDLMRYLCRLVTPPGGIVLDPFMGSGSTGKAAVREGFGFIGIEREAEYVEIAKARINSPVTTNPQLTLGT